MPKRGRRRKKTHTHVPNDENVAGNLANTVKVPKSLIIRRGKCESVVADLVADLRRLMMPFTALNFKEDATYRKLTLSKYSQFVGLPLGA